MDPTARVPRLIHGAAEIWVMAFVYFVTASMTIFSTRFGGGVACLWIATPILLAYLTVRRPKRWWPVLIACAIGSAFATSLFGFGLYAAPAFSVVNMAEAAIGALLLNFLSRRPSVDSVPHVAALIVCAGLVAPAITGFAGAGASWWATGTSYWENWIDWLAGHGLGAVTITPVAMLLMRGEAREWLDSSSDRQRLEAALLCFTVVGVTVSVFAFSHAPLLFLPFLPVIIATFRLGRLGAAGSSVIVTLVGGALTLTGHGPISAMPGSNLFHAQYFQFYTAILVLTALPVAAELKRRKHVFEALRLSEERYRLVTENATDIVLNVDVDGVIRYISPSVLTMTGYQPDRLVGTNPLPLIHPDERDLVMDAHLRALQSPGRTFTSEYRLRTMSGNYVWVETNASSLLDGHGRPVGVVGVMRNIMKRKSIEAKLTQAALTDPLTGLLNRRGFNSAIDSLVAGEADAKQGCLAIFDIDYFKRVNDNFGHDVGDRVLENFAETARRTVRQHDVVARLGGEEFGILLTGASMDEAARVCERLRHRIAQDAVTLNDGGSVRVTVSAGVAAIDGEGTRETVMRFADAALYEAKNAGRNRLARAA